MFGNDVFKNALHYTILKRTGFWIRSICRDVHINMKGPESQICFSVHFEQEHFWVCPPRSSVLVVQNAISSPWKKWLKLAFGNQGRVFIGIQFVIVRVFKRSITNFRAAIVPENCRWFCIRHDVCVVLLNEIKHKLIRTETWLCCSKIVQYILLEHFGMSLNSFLRNSVEITIHLDFAIQSLVFLQYMQNKHILNYEGTIVLKKMFPSKSCRRDQPWRYFAEDWMKTKKAQGFLTFCQIEGQCSKWNVNDIFQ